MSKVTLGPLVSWTRLILGKSVQQVLDLTLVQASSGAEVAREGYLAVSVVSAALLLEVLLVRILHSLRARVPLGERS